MDCNPCEECKLLFATDFFEMPSPFRQSPVLQSSAICVQTVLGHLRAFPQEEVSGRLGMIARERRQVEFPLNFVSVAAVVWKLSVLNQKFADKTFALRATVPQPRQGRKIVTQGASPGGRSPHPAFGTPLPRGRERGRR